MKPRRRQKKTRRRRPAPRWSGRAASPARNEMSAAAPGILSIGVRGGRPERAAVFAPRDRSAPPPPPARSRSRGNGGRGIGASLHGRGSGEAGDGGPVIAIVSEGEEEVSAVADDVIEVPEVPEYLQPLVTVVPLQLLAYHIALLRKCDVDKPRNLAKSVTVE